MMPFNSSQPEAGPSTRHRPSPLVFGSPSRSRTGGITTPASSTPGSFPSVERRVAHSTDVWARDLRSLFEHARDRFADVSWESEEGGDRVWGHKAVIYARAPKAFKDRYFISKPFSRSPTSLRSPSPHVLPPLFTNHSRPPSPPSSFFRSSPHPTASSSLTVNTLTSEGTARQNRHGDGVLRLTHGDTPEMFQAQLEWLYTGEGFGDVVEWISNDTSIGTGAVGSVRDSLGRRGDINERRDKLGQDLTYMWRSKLYADVRIHLDTDDGDQSRSEDSDDSSDSLSSTAVFTAHKAVLASRSPYFSNVLLNTANFLSTSTDDVYLPTPPFTPAALHFCLGYMYAGHLDFSNRTFDLATAFQIHRAALYLQLDPLSDEVESRLVHDFCHGLDKRRCKCRKCPLRAARVWRFASASDVGAVDLARITRAYIINAWGDSWGKEIGLADESDRRALVMDVTSNITHKNVISAFRSIASVKERIEVGIRARGRDAGPWVENLETMVDAVQGHARRVLLADWSKVVEATELWDLINGKGFSDDLLDTISKELCQALGTSQACAEGPRVYQALVSSILLKVDPDTLQTVVPPRGRARQQVEGMKDGVLTQIKRRWMQVRDGGGFDSVDNWALKEISDEIEVPVDDLLAAVDYTSPVTSPVQARFTPAISSPKASPRRSIPAVAQRAVSGESSRQSRVSLTSRTNGARPTPNRPPSPPDSSGLRRLRLSSSASSASMVSQRSVSRPTPPRAAEPETGPRARSPTAERQGHIVSIGAGRRSRLSNQSTTPTPPPQPRSMSGPPRQLLTRNKVTTTPERAARNASPGPNAPSVSGVGTLRTTRNARPSGSGSSLAPPLPISATRPNGRKPESEAGPSRLRSTPSSSTLASTRRPLAERKDKEKEEDVSPKTTGKGKEVSPRTVGRAGSTLARATGSDVKGKAPESSAAAASRARTTSMSTTASVRSRLSTVSKAPTTSASARPPVPSRTAAAGKAPATATTATTGKPPPTTSSAKVPTTTGTRSTGNASKPFPAGSNANGKAPVRKSASVSSLASRTTVASRVTTTRAPPMPKVPPKPTPTTSKIPISSPPKPTARTRNPSTASQAAKRPPANPGPPNTFPPSPLPQPPLRSASTSTDEAPHEVRTPTTSSRPYIPSPKVVENGSESDPVQTTPSPTKFPPVSLNMPRTSRKTSGASAVSVASARHHLHPASAFDPPKRRDEEPKAVLVKERPVPAGLDGFKGRGVQLNTGIPCIVSLNSRRARFRAAIRYIGHLDHSRGAWVGLECDDLERFGVSTLPSGSIGSTHYFHLSDPVELSNSMHDESRLARKKKVEAIRDSLRSGKNQRTGLGIGLGIGLQDGLASRSLTPFVEPHAGFENPRALFVRPSEIVHVMGAE